MASTRPTRKSSRMSSPFTSQRDVPIPAANKPKEEKKTFLDKWVEPPLRQPAPSFEDYKGLERHGVLEHMAPLGSLPSAKVKARVKIEGPRRVNRIKKKEAAAAKERLGSPDSSASANTRRSESRKVEENASVTPLLYEEAPEESNPASPSPDSMAKAVTAVKTSIASSSDGRAPDSHTPAGRAKLEQIVQAAMSRASEIGNPVLGLAIKQLHTESLQRRDLADLLDAVLSQRSTPRQTSEFQAYITQARKQIRSQKNTLNSGRRLSVPAAAQSTRSSKSPSKVARSVGATATGNNVSPLEATGPNHSDKSKSSQKESGKRRHANGMASQENIPLTRSKSASSSSSLSSMTSMDHAFTASMEVEPANVDVAETYASSPPISSNESQSAIGPNPDALSTSTPSGINPLKRSSAAAGLSQAGGDETLLTKRKRMAKSFDDYKVTESNVRGETNAQQATPQQVTPTKKSSSTPTPKQTLRLRNSTRKPTKQEPEELQSPSSSVTVGPRSPAPPVSTGLGSRASTPKLSGRPLQKNKKGARIKMSPSKKKSGVIAGIARGSGAAARSSLGYGPTDEIEDSENDEFCSACGGSGYLLCCDGCDRSFHFTCLDPPLDPSQPPDDSWYCFICEAKRGPPTKHPRGLFAALLTNLEKKNPVAFNLPREIREYFEGVRTGDEGEYEEAVTQKSNKPRAGYEEFPDLFRLRDSKGKYVLCFRCGKSALNNREIIPCDFCSLQWHLDCLDPPMANPPPKGLNGKSKHNWMCPNHIDHELLALDPSVKKNAKPAGTAGIGRTHKVRRPKNARIVDPALRRGFFNNGLIEIENDSSDEEAFHEQEEFGVVYRLPERGVKLDFIDKVKRTCWAETRPHVITRPASVDFSDAKVPLSAGLPTKSQSDFDKRSFADRQLALNLAQLASADSGSSLGVDVVENLINTLIAEAPSDVAALMTETIEKASDTPPSPPASDSRLGQSEAGVISDKERSSLLMLQELIRRRLESSGPAV